MVHKMVRVARPVTVSYSAEPLIIND